jgi:tripartite-type tricarboxylate transporter receptor subunit TctC
MQRAGHRSRASATSFSRRHALRLGAAGFAGVLGAPALTGCARTADAAAFPDRAIQVVVAYAAGGGTDVGARILQPYLEAGLGTPIEIVNQPGGGGWAGWNEIVNADPDGYTIGFVNTPNLMTGYLDPRLGRTDLGLHSFTLLGNQVTDYSAVAVRSDDDRFPDLQAMMERARTDPLTVTSTGVGSDDHYASLALADRYGVRFDALHGEGASDGITAVLGGHVDVVFANIGELKSLHEDGELRIIAVMTEGKRSPHLPEVPTLAEAGFGGISSWSSRGLAGPPNLDPQVAAKLATAVEQAVRNPEHVEKLARQGLEVDYRSPDQHREMLRQDEERTRQLGPRYVWG